MTIRVLSRLGLLLLGACGLDPEGGLLSAEAKQLVRDHEDSADVLALGAAIAAMPTSVLTTQTVTLADAVAAQASIADVLQPPGCVTTMTEGNRVIFTMSGCTGPWGRLEVNGQTQVTLSPGDGAGTFAIDFISEGLTLNGRPASFDVSADVEITEAAKTIAWTGTFQGTAADGREVLHDADIELVLNTDGSVSLSGSSSVSIGFRGVEVDIAELVRNGPVGTCPEGTVTVARKVGDLSVTLTFDGTNEYVAKTSRGGRGKFDLTCTPVGGT
ncbi:MAG: hypothetical protein HOV80_00615 [Polyangiaceae bacterium]|nr:hypothetical protein [Polyangiaceae bacterium]